MSGERVSVNKLRRNKGFKAALRGTDKSLFGVDSTRTVIRIAVAELLGTGLLVFLGCMGTVVGMGSSPPSHFQVALNFGLTVGSIIVIIGHISAAHLNPAVSAAAVVLEKINLPLAGVYIVSQCVGAVIGFGTLVAITPERILNSGSPNGSCCALCATVPHPELTTIQALLAEAFVTGILILLVCAVWDHRNAHNTDSAPLKFGFAIFAIACAEGPYTGASMNPARTLGPAVWTRVWTGHWIYWVAPVGSALATAFTYKFVFGWNSSPKPETEDVPEEVPLQNVDN